MAPVEGDAAVLAQAAAAQPVGGKRDSGHGRRPGPANPPGAATVTPPFPAACALIVKASHSGPRVAAALLTGDTQRWAWKAPGAAEPLRGKGVQAAPVVGAGEG